MFRQKPKEIESLVRSFLRVNGLETPWLQRRLVEAWDEVAGAVVASYTEDKAIRNQTLWVKIVNPAVRADLQMKRTELAQKLNAIVGAEVIRDIKIY